MHSIKFPTVNIGSCSFHFSHCLQRKIQKLGQSNYYRENNDFKKWYKMFMVTPFLLPQNIQEVVTTLFAQQHQANGTILTLIRKFKKLFQRQ